MLARLWKRLQPAPPDTDWEAYFEPGETLRWSGAPLPGIKITAMTALLSLFGLPFLFFGLGAIASGILQLFQMSSAADVGTGLFTLAFGLPFAAIGGGLSIGTLVFATQMHHFTRYALSDRRAYIAKSWWRHSMSIYPINNPAPLHLKRGKRDTVRFYKLRQRDSDGDWVKEEVAFEHIADGEKVYALFRDAQSKGD